MMSEDASVASHNDLTVFRGRVDSLSLYEITDYELESLEKGPQNSIYMNLSILLLSVGFSFMTTIFSVDFTSERIFSVFLGISLSSIVGGAILLLIWWRTRSDLSKVARRIRGRMSNSPVYLFRAQADLIERAMVSFNSEYARGIPAGQMLSPPTRVTIRELIHALEDLNIPYPGSTHNDMSLWNRFLPRLLAASRAGKIDEARLLFQSMIRDND